MCFFMELVVVGDFYGLGILAIPFRRARRLPGLAEVLCDRLFLPYAAF